MAPVNKRKATADDFFFYTVSDDDEPAKKKPRSGAGEEESDEEGEHLVCRESRGVRRMWSGGKWMRWGE